MPPINKPDPQSSEERRCIEELALRVDADLEREDVRLTMGGEPTFVGIDEPDSPQWNGEAMGPLKLERALTLIWRLQQNLAPGAVMHFGQGKWYPGERLPRWALSCYWRTDGVPIWENLNLIAQEHHDRNARDLDALRFLEGLARRLRVSVSHILPAYEDSFYYLWKERRLPVNLDPLSSLSDPGARERVARVFEAGSKEAVGYVLPLRRRHHNGRWYWSSQPWFVRPDRLLLIEGVTPIGNRLPFDSLPWVAPDDIEYDYPTDPFSDRDELPSRPTRRPDLFHTATDFQDVKPDPPRPGESAKGTSRPALSVQVREGRLHVFLPYIRRVSDYLDLIAAIEDTCEFVQIPIWLEGYTPPPDPRVNLLRLTPDPGVIEINLPPARTWDELQNITNIVYSEGSETRLTAHKFMHDGRVAATGGGNHIVIGGLTAADSPVLRRPDLLRSMVAFWQNHPSLSYLFSGKFIGPSSQYPRVDEARMDSLYELEIAFSQLPSGDCVPWLVDRLFRNLLIDVTGNTHRAEFCIDKLYPGDNAEMRLGLLELRAFEMQPDARMTLKVLLLIRALVAMFWRKPYRGALIRWDTALHDRYLLPHFVEQDFRVVLATLREFGYDFRDEWFAPHFEFRFPRIGSYSVDGIDIELRHALEAWHVLGDEANQGGTVRIVDSSLERLQVRASGLVESRHAVACNGRRIPLHATDTPGTAVAGIRYRVRQLSSCLHPNIPVHAPLVFDIVDETNGQSLGGCTYHVKRPDGRDYDTRPENASEAEGRCAGRFEKSQDTRAPMLLTPEPANPVYPMTLDLRWPVSPQTTPSTVGTSSR